ncbi:MAG: TetR/AcrR family transcriptional regulator, partial [Clostridia bacterium]|nr:TetR/AcrR family transcriptional regulator [Clostridia bacterium]
MDRRQRKTRDAIFKAFIQLLSQKNCNDITVGEIIDLADVGRATFYAHFETKD